MLNDKRVDILAEFCGGQCLDHFPRCYCPQHNRHQQPYKAPHDHWGWWAGVPQRRQISVLFMNGKFLNTTMRCAECVGEYCPVFPVWMSGVWKLVILPEVLYSSQLLPCLDLYGIDLRSRKMCNIFTNPHPQPPPPPFPSCPRLWARLVTPSAMTCCCYAVLHVVPSAHVWRTWMLILWTLVSYSWYKRFVLV